MAVFTGVGGSGSVNSLLASEDDAPSMVDATVEGIMSLGFGKDK